MLVIWFPLAAKVDVTVIGSGRHRRQRKPMVGARFGARCEAIVTVLYVSLCTNNGAISYARILTSICEDACVI